MHPLTLLFSLQLVVNARKNDRMHMQTFLQQMQFQKQLLIIEMPSSNVRRHEILGIQFALDLRGYISEDYILVIKLVKAHYCD